MQKQLDVIRLKLSQVAALDPELFAIEDEHEFQLAPPLDEAELSAWEERNGATLPDDYRAFLLQIGSAGTGPGYGLEPLTPLLMGAEDDAAQPFPLSEFLDVANNPDGLTASAIASDNWLAGTIYLGTEGCGMCYRLVVVGDERGQVWMDDRSNSHGIYPVAPNRDELGGTREDTMIFTISESNETRASFLDWYEWWLDWLIEESKITREDADD